MNSHERFTDGSKAPTEKEILLGTGRASPMWRELKAYVVESYGIAPELVFYGRKHGWTVRYRRSSKALCSLFPEKSSFTVLIVLGKAEAETALAQKRRFSANVRRVLEEAEPLHDGRWLWIRPMTGADLDSIKALLRFKRKPIERKRSEI